MRSEQSLFDRLGQVSDVHSPRAPIANIAVMLDERMLARLDNARGFGIRPQGAHVDDHRNPGVSRRGIDNQPKVIFSVNCSAAKKGVALFHPGCRQTAASARSRKSSAEASR